MNKCLTVVIILLALLSSATGEETTILDTSGFWRMFHKMSSPLIRTDEGLKPTKREAHLDHETQDPPAGWTGVDFDDTQWPRAPFLRAADTPYLERACLRGKFTVSNPSAVQGLKLTVGYHGGIIIYLNGKEIKRSHVSKEEKQLLAEDYPAECFVTEKGEPFQNLSKGKYKPTETEKAGLAKRERFVKDLIIESSQLSKGVNVLALEIIRAPYHKIHWGNWEGKYGFRGDGVPFRIGWYTCETRSIQLTATSSAGITPNFQRPKGFQVWNSQQLAGDFDLDFGDPNEQLHPVRLVGARNGTVSGKFVIGSDKAIKGLSVKATALNGKQGGSVPAEAVHIRYGMPWRTEQFTPQYISKQTYPYAGSATNLAALFEEAPEEIPVKVVRKTKSATYAIPGAVDPVPGAVASIWLTVSIPEQTPAGEYTGTVQVKAQGVKEISVPVSLSVADWRVPDGDDWHTVADFIQSPDTLAVEYEEKLWSDKHFSMIENSLKYLGEAGCRNITVPVLCKTHYGNPESMIRWIDKGNNTYEYDYSIMDRYIDAAEKNMGKLRFISLYVWDVFLIPSDDVGKTREFGANDKSARGRNVRHTRVAEDLKKAGLLVEGPPVSMMKNGKLETVHLPSLQAPESKAIWKHFFDTLKAHLKKRGLEDTLLIGISSDGVPTKSQVEFFKEVSGGIPWQSHSHVMFPMVDGKLMIYNINEVGMQALNHRFWVFDIVKENKYGWKLTTALGNGPTGSTYDTYPVSAWKHIMEYTVNGGFNCVRLKGDMWSCVKDRRGRRRGSVEKRYPENSWKNLDILISALAPGPKQAVATTRLEMFRQGMQEVEARIIIEKALTDQTKKSKIGNALAQECEEFLNERTYRIWKAVHYMQMDNGVNFQWYSSPAGHIWYMGSGWQERTHTLFSLAGKVARKLGLEKKITPQQSRKISAKKPQSAASQPKAVSDEDKALAMLKGATQMIKNGLKPSDIKPTLQLIIQRYPTTKAAERARKILEKIK